MLNRTASPADLSRTLEAKSVRQPWNPALHPRDSKGRFIETGGIARLWSGKLARVVRALPRDRVLVQDRVADGTYTGRRHSTSARWITMVARPDGSAPTKNQQKVEVEDARREGDDQRGLGLSRDDQGDPDTPDEPHRADDDGNDIGDDIGDDDGDAPDDGDDQDEPDNGHHEVDTEALPNRKATKDGARFEDTAAVRRHFLDLAQRPEANAPALRRLAGDEDLQIIPSGGLVTIRDDANGRWYLTSTGTGGYLDVGDFGTREEAEAAGEYIHDTVRNGHIAPGEFNEPIDFSDPDIAKWFLKWRSPQGEDAEQGIRRAISDFHASRKNGDTPAAPAPKRTRAQPRGRFTTLQQARANWAQRADALRASGAKEDRSTAQDLDSLAKEQRLKLVGDGQFVARRVEDDWYLYATGSGQQMSWWFDRQADAKGFAEHIVGTLKDKDGNALDFSDPKFAEYRGKWRSAKGRDYHQEWTVARALWDQEHPPKHSIASARLAETLRRRPFGDDEDQTPQTDTAEESAPDTVDAPEDAQAQPAADPATQNVPADQEVPETAPEDDVQPDETPEPPAADGRPAGVPEDAEPVEGVDSYWTTWSSGNVTVYGPDGKLVGRVVGSYSDRHATVDGVHIPIGDSLSSADQIIARHHIATTDPAQADHVHLAWTTHKGKRVIAIRGTIKNDARDDRAVGVAGKLAWSPVQNARITGTQWKPETRDRKAAQVLAAFARQGRNVRITDEDANTSTDAPEQLDEDTKKLRAMSDADLRGHSENLKIHARVATTPARKQKARAALQKIDAELDRRRIASQNNHDDDQGGDGQAAKPSPQERAAAMSDDDLTQAISSSERDRSTYGSRRGDLLNEDEQAQYADRRRRTNDRLSPFGNPEDLSDNELAAYAKELETRKRTHQLSTSNQREEDIAPERDLANELNDRLETAETEQQARQLRDIEKRPPVQDLDDGALEKEFQRLPIRLRRLGTEQNEVLSARRHAVYEERQNRKANVYRNGPEPTGLSDGDLDKEFRDLHKNRNLASGREREALEERLKALFDEQNRRGAEGRERTVSRADTREDPMRSGGYGTSVRVDGNDYGKVVYSEHGSPYAGGHKAGWNAQLGTHGRILGAYPTMTEALAALVDSYDTDPDTEPVRLYGSVRRVWVPKMFFELYQSSRRADSFKSASKERQTLYALFKGHGYGWSDGSNPLTGKIGKGANLDVPEGLLAEFQRVTDELSREMMLRASDRELDSSDRSKAKTRLASINAALHGIDGQRTVVRKDGGDDDRKVISREEIEAQQAALRAALGTDEGADSEHLQPGGQGPLDEVPAAGAGGDDRSGDVLPEQGPGDRDGDSGGRGGTGADRAGRDGVRGPGGSDQADQGERDGAGAARPAAGAGADGRGADDAQPGDAGSEGDAGRGVRHVAPRFRPNPADAATKGPVQRAAANVEAIRVLKRLEQENRPATEKEKVTLARWSGWGSVPIMFAGEPNEKEPRYQQGGARYGKFAQDFDRWAEYRDPRTMLQNELTPLEWRQASRGTLSMHYTPQPIAEAMWDGLKALGFDRGDVLEAGSGAGTFFGVSPDGARLTGIELDPTTARIAQAIYPDANVLNENFAETDAHPGSFDASIGNVPFASVPFGDKRYPAESLHNGFITKELALTRPGGITLLITSRHTLDSKGDKARKQIAKYGDLIGAVRLPSGVFNDAGTSVVTDVLVLRRRADGEEPGDTSWLNAPERKIGDVREHVNAYFTAHPDHVLGDLATESSPYGPRLTVKGEPAKAADQLRDALQGIAAQALADGNGYQPHPDGDDRPPVLLQTARQKHANDWTGRLYEGDDGQLYQHVNGGNPVTVAPSDGRTDQLRALMQLRDVAAELRELDRKNDEDDRAEKLRAQLRDLHTAYVDTYGPLSKPGQTRSMKTGTRPDGKEERTPTAWGYFRSDPDAGSVLALERWDADKGEPILSRVFNERAAARRQPLTRTDDPKAALAAVVAATGEVDLGEVSRLLNLNPQDAVQALGNEVFTNPSTGRLELAGAYLSGPVRDKLEAARRAAEQDPAFAVNVASLTAVQPTDRTIGEFTPEMGAHWTPPELLQGFLREYLGDRTLRVAHDDRYGWMLYTGKVPQANNVMYGVQANDKKGTRGKGAVDIARAILGHGSLTIYRDDKRRDVDEETSRLVRQKADQMRSEFAKYATANADRLTRLTDSYNKIMNGHVVRSYDGMSPSLEGFTPDRTPHSWQLSGAARMQFERSVVLAHEVGLGKTSTLVMGTQALRASGQIEKPFAVVPDHLAQQWYDEARFLYPNAEIHLITSADLADGRRDSTLEWLRANKSDLVIFTEPAFGSIKMSPEAQDDYEFRELEALREQLDRQYEDADNPNHPFIVAKIEQRIATVQNRISKNAAPMRTPGETYWDDLGFDYAVIDEAHRYKGVGFRSKEGGGDPATVRGIDLHQKLTDLHRRRAGRATVTLATGTPLSNSITEQYTMLALAAPWVLDAYKAGAPDLWAATFGRKTLRVENAPDGSGLRIVERFSEFHNRRAMKTMWGLVADTKRADDVGIPRPKVKGGSPSLVLIDSTKDQAKRLKKLVGRGRAIHMGEPQQIRNRKGALVDDNMLAVSGEGTSVALDPRLVDPKAPAGNKLRAVAAKHVERYHRHKDRTYKTYYGSTEDHPTPGALQMIFLNEGVPGGDNKGSFDAYAALRDLMVQGGIPAEKIAFVQDHKKSGKPEEVAELFRKARDGDIAVLIGSSSVAGTGMNAQNRMVSLTHVDLDWGAAQMEQRNGRILRYGNQNDEVEIDIFATKGSLDGWKAGFVAAKAEGLVDIQRPDMADSDTRDTVTELDVDYPDYETMEAEIGGNPYMSQLMKARRALRDLEIDQHNEAAERVRRQETLADLQQELTATRDGITRREEALPRIRDVRDSFAMNLGGLSYTERSDAAAALHRQVTTQLLEHDRDGMGRWKVLGQFGGLDVGVRTERRADGKLVAHVGFPDLARSDFERGPEDLKKKGAGSGMLTRLTNALDKAPALQQADRARMPELDEQIALLQSAQAAADFTPQIEHARARANLLDNVVGRVSDLDKLPEIDEDELDKKLTKAQRRDVVEERQQARIPLQEAVAATVARLEEFDREHPEPERTEKPQEPDRVRLSTEEVAQTLSSLRGDIEGKPEGPAEPLKHAWDRPELFVTLTMPSALADFLNVDETAAMEDPDTRKALTEAVPGRNGTLKVTGPIGVHRALLQWAWMLEGGDGLESDPSEVRAFKAYSKRVDEAEVELRRRRAKQDAAAAPKEEGRDAPGAAADTDSVTPPPAPGASIDEETPEEEGAEGPAPVQGGALIAGRFQFNEPVTDPDGQGWYVNSENPDGTVNVGNGPSHTTFKPDELTSARKDTPDTADVPEADSPASDDTVILDRDEVAQQLDDIRPEGTKAPSGMADQEIADEIVGLMEREMADGELTGADRTRMAVLEAEKDRRAGRTPKSEPKKPEPAAPESGLFDVDEPETQAPAVADPNNPLDQPDDEFGTPDMFADHEGRDTARLRPVQMRTPADLAEGDRYTDADGRTHTVAEPPRLTGRGRVRIVTNDGEERFYNRDAELQLRYPDEEITDARDEPTPDVREGDAPEDGTADDRDAGNTPAVPRDEDTTRDEAPEPEPQDNAQQPEDIQRQDQEDEERDDERNRRGRDTDADAASPGGAPQGAGGGPQTPNAPNSGRDESSTDANEPDAQDDEDDRDRRRRRRRRGNGGTGGQGPGALGGPGLPRPSLPHLPQIPASSGGGDGAGRDGGDSGPDGTPPRTVGDLRDVWRRGDRLTADENTPERRAFLTQLADNPTLTMSSGGGLVTWTDDTTDGPGGVRQWRFAQARNGGRLGKISVSARNAEEARELADRFEDITDENRLPIDWHQPLTGDAIAQWRDDEGRPLPEALRAVRDAFLQDRERDSAPQAQPEPAVLPDEPQPAALPDSLNDMSDDDLAAAWGTGLAEADQMRVMEEMDRRDNADKRVRDAIPATPADDAEEVRRRGEAMDAALGFGTTDVTRRPQTREERLQREFQDLDEARYSAAIDATNGYFFSNASRRLPPVGERDLFSGGNLSRFGRWRDYASEELIEWFDNNGGRLTYNQFKQKRRADEKIERDQHEEEQRLAAAAADATTGTNDTAGPSADGIDLPSFTLTPESEEDGAIRFGGASQVRAFADRAELRPAADNDTFDVWMDGRRIGTVRNVNRRSDDREPMWDATPLLTISHDHNSRSSSRDLAVANLVVRALQNPADATSPDQDTWDAVKIHLAGRYPELPELPDSLSKDPAVKERYDSLVQLVESFRTQQTTNGDLKQDLEHARDEFEWLRDTLSAAQGKRQDRDMLKDLENRSFWASYLRDGFAPDDENRTAPEARAAEPSGQAPATPDAADTSTDTPSTDAAPEPARSDDADQPVAPADQPPAADTTAGTAETPRDGRAPDAGIAHEANRDDDSATARTSADDTTTPDAGAARAPRPEPEPSQTPDSTDEETSEPEPRPEPEPIGGQPAHWASVDQLQPGDMARIDGTTRRGRAVTLAGYVLDTPERVTVTRRGRTEDMWRTTIGESPDGRTGGRSTVYTPLNASAARAEAPENTAPGTPASGAQGDVISGDLPDTIATDTRGRGLFPGSRVTGNGDREGTVTGVTDTTVSVRWTDGDTDNGVAPTSLTVDDTDDRRPAGWTSTGQRVRPGHVVSDENGALLGPVDEANGDRITVTTAEGTITRDAADLRVVGEVRDDTPETAPVTGISEPTADEVNKGDIIVLDLDGAPTTVEVLNTNRVGDRVTIDYVDTTTGELGTIDMDATAVVHKAEGPNGAAPDLGPDDAPAPDDDLTVHEPLPALDPVTGPTVDPDLTTADRDAIADQGNSPEDDPDAQQAAARLGADLPVTPEQATALAAQLRANADPATTEGRAALRAADHLDRAASRTAPEGLDRPRPSNAAQISEGDVIAMPDERRGDEVHVYRVIDVEEGPGGVRSLLLEDENRQWKRRIVHAAMPVWQLPEPEPDTTDSNVPDPTPAPAPRDPNPPIASVRRQIVADHSRTVAMRIIDEAVAGTEPPGDIHALREQIAQRLTPDALQDARNAARQDANAALNAAGITGRDHAAVQQALRRAREKAHERTVRAALRTINDLEPLPGEPNEDLAQRAAGLLRLIPDQVDVPSPSRRRNAPDGDGAADATTHVDDAVTALLRQLEEAGADPADIDALTRLLTAQLDGTRQATARRIVRRAATAPDAGPQPGLLARVIALLGRMGRRLIELVKAAAQKIAELWRNNRDRLSRLKAFLRRLVRRVRDWPESRRLARLHAALDLPDVDGESLAARVSQWAALLPEQGRFGQASRRVSWWRPTTWAQLAAGRLPGRSSETRWVPDRASDGGPGLTALRHMAALRAAGTDVDQEVTRRLADALGDDFGGDPHGTLQHADDYMAATERRLLNLQAARGSSTIQDPDVDVEIAAARMEAAAARREWEELRTRNAAAVPDAVAAALADIRDLGPQGNAGIVFGPDTTPDAERAVRGAQRLIPRDWLATPDGRRLTAVDGDAGRYEPDARRATVADLGDEGVGTAAYVLAQHLAGHLPDLDAAQRAFWFTRTHTGRPGARTLDRTALGRLLAQQQTQTDTGDSLARSLQAMFTGDWYEDDDLRAFLLGLLATR
ncbi:hypothetical protein [Streptomyces lunaelactis]|uniref:hypothetical protein n=1 Tax=Streptomyces lunaelactis TaxID=1535768 RepID=UPI001584560D|nr:hypothetical protein [Streptomyces lunaelactis]NUL21834.1 hypothetical protein [Streptomyces lunaelactis]